MRFCFHPTRRACGAGVAMIAACLAGPPGAAASVSAHAAAAAQATSAPMATKYIPLPLSQNPANIDIPFSAAVWAGDTLYVSGWLDPDMKTHANTRAQTVGILDDLRKFLATQNLTMGDVVMMREYLQEGKAQILEARAGYAQFFGTRDQPHKPASTAIFVDLPSSPRGALVEIDLVAVRSR